MDTLDMSFVDSDAYQGRYDALSTGMDDVLGVTGKRVEGCISHDITVSDDGQAVYVVVLLLDPL